MSRSTLAPGIVDLRFALREPATLSFRAGQFVSVAVAVGEEDSGADQDPRRGAGARAGRALGVAVPAARRSYSIASPSDQDQSLRFIIRAIPGGVASDFLMTLAIGSDVRMTGPHGFFVLDPRHPGDVIFGATGTGVSAVMPMLGELAGQAVAEPAAERRILYWGVRAQEDLFARAEIEALCRRAGCALRVFLTRPPERWQEGRGRITAAILTGFPDMTAPTFYLVGNGAMIAELKRELIARGVNRKKQIRTEAFFD